ncbi:MAG: hypothetical protein ACOZBW_02170 [Thermodesulfobacteriota bacterium]
MKPVVSRKLMMLLVLFSLIGIVVIISGFVSLIQNIRMVKIQKDGKFRLIFLGLLAVSFILAVCCFFVEYPYGETKRIVGFPFPAGGFVKVDDRWLISMGALTLPLGFANALFGFVLPHLILSGFRRKNAG